MLTISNRTAIALGAVALRKSSKYINETIRATKCIALHRTGDGGFGSTQATILVLKATLAVGTGKPETVRGENRESIVRTH